ncbi:putative RNA-directed DNA polymerase [Rosa chinensis]|uniref:Putative RNA-directed DNA polymerase n=1 Tax=Rosa chinensis TaxID=74649 RepID=A0A2P6QQZ3_ROSCH|nr:putative RNA-directed DNA polymerase [Rosa chinensis]
MWLEHPSFKENFRKWWDEGNCDGWKGFRFMRKLKNVKGKLKIWSRETFGDIGKEKKVVEARINELDEEERSAGICVVKKREREVLRGRLEELALREEIFWRQRAKLKWAKEGDNNTRFFHKLVNGRRKRNVIEKLELSNGIVVEEEDLIEEEIIRFYKNLYSSKEEVSFGIEGLHWNPISVEKARWLETPFEEEEIKRAVFECDTVKSPGPDGFSFAVLQRNWEVVKREVLDVMAEFHTNGVVNKVTNETYICLIPKKANSLKVGDYRPISLITSLYKIIAKVLAWRLREVLSDTISGAQGAFIKGRQILDAVLVANEVVDETRKKKKEGLVFKIDFEKAYDHVEWNFLDYAMESKGFGDRWRKWIGGCLRSANFSIQINGRPRGKFGASRGLRQGDPLSSFLFTLVVDVLDRLMERARDCRLIEGLVVGREEVEITHLQFADDTIFFLKDDDHNWNNLNMVLESFCLFSGLKINKSKCSVVGINTEAGRLERMADDQGCEIGVWPMKYLGLPLGGNPKQASFWNPVVEKIEKSLEGWKKAFLSRGGRLTLIQAVLSSLPTYYLSLFQIPVGVAKRLESLLKIFFWDGVGEGKKTI